MTTKAEGDVEGTGAAGEDRALMARVRGGDEGAFGRLMERWERPVKSVVARPAKNSGCSRQPTRKALLVARPSAVVSRRAAMSFCRASSRVAPWATIFASSGS